MSFDNVPRNKIPKNRATHGNDSFENTLIKGTDNRSTNASAQTNNQNAEQRMSYQSFAAFILVGRNIDGSIQRSNQSNTNHCDYEFCFHNISILIG